jgi:triosephosphate isomerase
MADFLSFEFIKKSLENFGLKVGVQDIFWEDSGAYTGEVSPSMLASLGCDSAFLGHFERRTLFGENDENLNRKLLACLRNGLTPFYFIGEGKDEHAGNLTEKVLANQLRAGLKGIDVKNIREIVFIYEPIWVIGQKASPSVDLIRTVYFMIKDIISDIYGNDPEAGRARILYGGSIVDLKSLKDIMSIKELDGVGIARAAVDPLSLIDFIKATGESVKNRL